MTEQEFELARLLDRLAEITGDAYELRVVGDTRRRRRVRSSNQSRQNLARLNVAKQEIAMSELGDSRLDVNFDDVYDFETVPDSEEVQLRVTSAEIYRKEGGTRANLHLVFEVLDNPKASDIHLYMGIPNRDEDAKTANRLKLRLKAFYDAAEADPRGAVGELVGSTLWVIVGEEEDPQYGKRNFIRKFQATR